MTTKQRKPRGKTRAFQVAAVLALTGLMSVSNSAQGDQTLLMPTRDFLRGEQGIVWGISTNPTNTGTGCTLNFGDGTPVQSCSSADNSYIAYPHVYNAAGTFTVSLDVNGNVAQVEVNVFDPLVLNDADERAVRINMSIQDGLRYLWQSQDNRTTFATNQFASWGSGGEAISMTSLVVLAFENHGFLLPNSNATPSGLYQRFVVQRGLNYIANELTPLMLSVQQPGNRNPCVGLAAGDNPCLGLYNANEDPGYGTALAALPFAGSTASQRPLPAGILDEDINNNGSLDPGEDLNGNGQLDYSEDWDGDGEQDTYSDGDGDGDFYQEDFNYNGIQDNGETDYYGDGNWDYLVDDNGDGDFRSEYDYDSDGNFDLVDEDTNFNGALDGPEDLNGNGQIDSLLGASATIGNVLQRLVNAIAFGQNDEPVDAGPCTPFNYGACGRGGWVYDFTDSNAGNGGGGGGEGVAVAAAGVVGPGQRSDGSTVGWDILAMLDANAAGATVPGFVMTEFRDHALPNGINTDGSFDYSADGAPGNNDSTNPAKAGIALQGLFWTSAQLGVDARVQSAIDYITARWNGGGEGFNCFGGPNSYNKGCAYGMFNVFKALKLHNVATLPIGDPDGAGPLTAGDWHGDYENYLIAAQVAPNTTGGGQWDTSTMGFSCCFGGTPGITALAELVLAPVALVLPDPEYFGDLGLTHTECIAGGGTPDACNDSWTNPARTLHNVTATALSFPNQQGQRSPVAGASVDFLVISGPNTGKSGADVTDAEGEAHFEYTDDKTVKGCDADGNGSINATDLAMIRAGYGPAAAPTTAIDTIRATIGSIQSNTVTKIWTVRDPRDGNRDNVINALDTRFCQLRQGT